MHAILLLCLRIGIHHSIVAVSATLPNLPDVGRWICAPHENIFAFDATFRPVKLDVYVQGYDCEWGRSWLHLSTTDTLLSLPDLALAVAPRQSTGTTFSSRSFSRGACTTSSRRTLMDARLLSSVHHARASDRRPSASCATHKRTALAQAHRHTEPRFRGPVFLLRPPLSSLRSSSLVRHSHQPPGPTARVRQHVCRTAVLPSVSSLASAFILQV
jgi:hypothetical protein